MRTQNLPTLQVFQLLSRKCRNHFLQSCPKDFIRFLCDCIVNLLKGKMQAITKHHVVKFQDEVRLLMLERTFWKQRRNALSLKRGLQRIAVIAPPVINHFSCYGTVSFRPSNRV